MDIGDIIRLLFFAFLFLSLFGGLFGRNSEKKSEGRGRAPRPTELGESGGQIQERVEPRPQPQPQQSQGPGQQWSDGRYAGAGRSSGNGRDRSGPPSPSSSRANGRSQPEARRYQQDGAARGGEEGVRTGEQELLEQDLTMDVHPEQTRRRRARPRPTSARRKAPSSGGDALRKSLKDSDGLERAFIVKEVLDVPVGMRKSD